jgi:hypothetical protein
MWEP